MYSLISGELLFFIIWRMCSEIELFFHLFKYPVFPQQNFIVFFTYVLYMSCETLFLGILYFWLPLFKGSPPSHYSYLTFSTEVAGPLSSLLHSRLEAPAPTYALIPAGNSRVEAGPGSLPSPPPLTVLPPWSQCEGGGPAVLGNKRGSANLAKLPRSDQQWKNELIASSLYPVTEVSFHKLWL